MMHTFQRVTQNAYFVSTLAHYVLVDATSEDEAKELAEPQLRALGAKTEIHTVRRATDAEIELWNFHCENLEREQA